MSPNRKKAPAVRHERDAMVSIIRARYACHVDPGEPGKGSRRPTPGVDGRGPSRDDGVLGVPFAIVGGVSLSIGTLLSGVFTVCIDITKSKEKYVNAKSDRIGKLQESTSGRHRFPSLDADV